MNNDKRPYWRDICRRVIRMAQDQDNHRALMLQRHGPVLAKHDRKNLDEDLAYYEHRAYQYAEEFFPELGNVWTLSMDELEDKLG